MRKIYWLRGGIIGLLVSIGIMGEPLYVSIPAYTVFGIFIGWLYGKIKNRKKLEANTSQL